ncbi:vacuolar amino acid transporter 3, partial [Aureobasidium melanogenum]
MEQVGTSDVTGRSDEGILHNESGRGVVGLSHTCLFMGLDTFNDSVAVVDVAGRHNSAVSVHLDITVGHLERPPNRRQCFSKAIFFSFGNLLLEHLHLFPSRDIVRLDVLDDGSTGRHDQRADRVNHWLRIWLRVEWERWLNVQRLKRLRIVELTTIGRAWLILNKQYEMSLSQPGASVCFPGAISFSRQPFSQQEFVNMSEEQDIPEEQQAQVVSEHLPSGYTAEFTGNNNSGSGVEDSLNLQGGDIHRDIFKLNAQPRQTLHQRAATFSAPRVRRESWDSELTAAQTRAPGAFRRQYMQRNQTFNTATMPVTRNFVEFLNLYGSFAGEDLNESDDEAVEDEDEEEQAPATESRPLLGRRKSSRVAPKGDAGMVKSFFTLLKAFIGTGIMFLPKAFSNGGILFSSLTMVSISLVSMLAFHLLLKCRNQYGGGYGDLGKAIAGDKMRSLILASITISQIGFVCAGVVFVAENLHSFLEAVVKGDMPVSVEALIAMQLIVLVPLSFIRNISKLGPVALLADVFILIGLGYIYYFDISTLAKDGIDPAVRLFNPNSFTLTIGSAIFTFEGIGLILPIQSSMKKPQNFEWLLAVIMLLITIIFTSVGALCYATFGDDTQIEIITNFPQDSKLVNAVQFLYSMAVLFGNPVQLFPAMRIMEGKLFGHLSGKKDVLTKWKKNAFRTFLTGVCIAIAIAGAGNLDRFVALIGSFACVPLVYIYPPLLHYKGCAESRLEKAGDILFMVIGIGMMIYTTGVTLANSF